MAAFAPSGSVALLVIGGAWIAMAGSGLRFSRCVAYELRLDEGQVIFDFLLALRQADPDVAVRDL